MLAGGAAVLCCWLVGSAPAQEQTQPAKPDDPAPGRQASGDASTGTKKPLPPLPDALQKLLGHATALNPENTVFLDKPGNRVLLRTEVACPDCILEMLLVPEHQREHETIFRIRTKAFVIHSALLALGLETGQPVEFSPEFKAPQGATIDITAVWAGDDGMPVRHDVRSLVRHNIHRYYASPLKSLPPGLEVPYKELRYDRFTNELLWYGPLSTEDRDDLLGKSNDPEYQNAVQSFFRDSQSRAMTADFVFVGSTFFSDPETGEQFYGAEGGHLICVSNFGDAMIDVREESSASDGSQVYEGWKEKLPPQGTPVILELAPRKPNDASDTRGRADASTSPARKGL